MNDENILIVNYTNNRVRKNLRIPRQKALEFEYFRTLFEADPNLREITLEPNPFIKEILDLILEEDEAPIENLYLEECLRFLEACAYLGASDNRFIHQIKYILQNSANINENFLIIGKHFKTFLRFGLLNKIAFTIQHVFTEYQTENGVYRLIKYIELSSDNRKMLIKIVPYMSSFARAFVICDIYKLDYNLIKAKLRIRDIFLYQYLTRDLPEKIPTERVCLIYSQAREKLFTFLRYFDTCIVSYGYSKNDHKKFDDGYPSFEDVNGFHLRLTKDVKEEWKLNDVVDIYDLRENSDDIIRYERTRGNKISPIPESSVNFFVLGKVFVEDLPIPVSNDEFKPGSVFDPGNIYLYDDAILREPPVFMYYNTKQQYYDRESKNEAIRISPFSLNDSPESSLFQLIPNNQELLSDNSLENLTDYPHISHESSRSPAEEKTLSRFPLPIDASQEEKFSPSRSFQTPLSQRNESFSVLPQPTRNRSLQMLPEPTSLQMLPEPASFETPPRNGSTQTRQNNGSIQTRQNNGSTQTHQRNGFFPVLPLNRSLQTPPHNGSLQTPPHNGSFQTPPRNGLLSIPSRKESPLILPQYTPPPSNGSSTQNNESFPVLPQNEAPSTQSQRRLPGSARRLNSSYYSYPR